MSEAAAIMGREVARPLGAQFTAARERRGWSLEQVSREMHVRVERLREIENDDYSQFSHVCYRLRKVSRHPGGANSPPPSRPGSLRIGGLPVSPGCRLRLHADQSRASQAFAAEARCGGPPRPVQFERLGLNRVAGGDQAAVVAPASRSSVPAPAVTPESSTGPVGTKPERPEGAPANPVRGPISSDAESALLVGADLDHSDRIR